jgi:hypothetical protein
LHDVFLNPWLLMGVLGIGVPIAIHLLNRRRFRRVVWAAMRFVQVSMEKNRRRMIVEDMLLLALRCLLVALLAIALARPSALRGGWLLGPQPVTAVLLLDNSCSMGKTDGNTTRYTRALAAADALLANLPKGSSAALLVLADAQPDPIPQPTADLPLVRQALAHVPLTDCGTGIHEGFKRAYNALANAAGANKRIYLLSDLQADAWGGGGGDREPAGKPTGGIAPDLLTLLDKHRNDVQVRVLRVTDDDTRNLHISAMRLATELPTTDKPLRFEVEVANDGPAEVRDVAVRLFADAQDPASRNTPLDAGMIPAIPAGAARSLSLNARITADGYQVVRARLTPDRLPADDERALVIRVLREIQVLLVNGATAEGGQRAQEEDVFFVRIALQAVSPVARAAWFF